MSEQLTIGKIESQYMKKSRPSIYMALEEMDLIWNVKDVMRFDKMWKQGIGVEEMIEVLGRSADEILALALDRGAKGKIKSREGGFIGGIG